MAVKKPAFETKVPSSALSFDVTVERVVGTVVIDEYGEEPPMAAALRLIGEAGECGSFRFTMPQHGAQGNDLTFRVDISVEEEAVS